MQPLNPWSKDTLYLPASWLAKWKGSDPFTQVLHLQGKIFRTQPGRKTLCFIENGQAYFLKIHEGIDSKEIFKNIFQGRLPIFGAANEINAITHLKPLALTPELIGYGKRGRTSFVITKALSNTISLEDFCKHWPLSPPAPQFKWALIQKVAHIAKAIHGHGINHRDFYLCHFLLDITGGIEFLNAGSLTLYVIDWHRAQIRKKVPFRWRVKDIAGLYFSAMNIGLTQRDLYRFMKIYGQNTYFWKQVKQRAHKLYAKIARKNGERKEL
jgi:heptose I phosphotransferase